MAEKMRETIARSETGRFARQLVDGVKPGRDEHGRTPLFIAAAAGQNATCELLLLQGLDINAADSSGVTPLQKAAAEGHSEVVELLLKHGADISCQDNIHGDSALHESSWRGYSRTVAVLAKGLGTQRVPLHARNLAGFAPLHLACQNGHNQSCRELLLAGCNPDLQNNYGDTPLHTSARYGHAGVTRILISGLCRVSDQNKNGDTALHIAAAMGRRKLTRILLEAGCDRSLRNKQGETAKDIARRKNLSEILEIINKSRSKSRSRSKSEDKVNDIAFNTTPEIRSAKGEKKREKTGSGTSGSRDGGTKKETKKHKNDHKSHIGKAVIGKQWSPYGCHYYPDPEAFPQPKLDSLPSDPLARGEQYYLDLAGNIRKGPVGVGYTCYCAPFFRHMEAKLERDKAELKAHIDQAHERLDLKVAHLERRTRGQISELTRYVAAERSKCEERHAHLRRWIHRKEFGRHSERLPKIVNEETNPLTKARSLEDLLDERPQDRSFEIQGETNGRKGSLDNLDIPPIPRLSKSCKDVSVDGARPALSVLNAPQRLNETFDGVIARDRTSPLGAAASPTIHLKHEIIQQQMSLHYDIKHSDKEMAVNEETREGWKLSPTRRSVHEMIKRFQQTPGIHHGWRSPQSASSERTVNLNLRQSSTGHRIQTQGTASSGRHVESHGNESESSEAEDDVDISPITNGNSQKRFDRVSENSHYDSIARMPYRSRSAVYSPTPPLHDAHNDSGYSTKMYGSSKGASPSLSAEFS
ncbi:ankyrin repeat domain-containing protein 6 isoform X2 [Fopius arisanus]|uniref:ANKRD6_0 protein n=1 Tax=Fopius arisanus TaxID=64838 RepID=A0A0C9QBA5_9HYME|nr:PREDICTED: ankyrin repeat domain-containing protein 6 isoform X2 [Fopius arisanus]